MTEDQKDPMVQRNYMGSHKRGSENEQENMDEQDDSSNDSSGSEDTIESTQEIKEQEPVKLPHKQEVPLAYKDNSKNGI